jgi:hypothetical protein
MGLFDILRGQRAPKRANLDRLFAISTSAITVQTSLGFETSGRAGLCFKSLEAGVFDELVRDIDQLLRISGGESGTTVERHSDEYGFSWIILNAPDIDDLVTTTHVVSQTMEERGFSEQLLCAVFGFVRDGTPLDLIYNYKRGTFYPFAPTEGKKRDNALELRVKAGLESEMPIEPELERWYALWDAPVQGSSGGI